MDRIQADANQQISQAHGEAREASEVTIRVTKSCWSDASGTSTKLDGTGSDSGCAELTANGTDQYGKSD